MTKKQLTSLTAFPSQAVLSKSFRTEIEKNTLNFSKQATVRTKCKYSNLL